MQINYDGFGVMKGNDPTGMIHMTVDIKEAMKSLEKGDKLFRMIHMLEDVTPPEYRVDENEPKIVTDTENKTE